MLKEKIKRKLSSRQGTSIFFGLLLFLAASILSVVLINGAVTTVKRVASDRKTEQNYLSCSSAAKLLRERIENTKIIRTTVVKTSDVGTGGSGKTETTVTWTTGTEKENSGEISFEEILKKYIQELESQSDASTSQSAQYKWKLSVKQAATSGESDMQDVFANCTITGENSNGSGTENSGNSGINISILLTTGTGTDSCQMVLSLIGTINDVGPIDGTEGSGNDKKKTSTTTRTYTWTAKDIIYGDQERTMEGK